MILQIKIIKKKIIDVDVIKNRVYENIVNVVEKKLMKICGLKVFKLWKIK